MPTDAEVKTDTSRTQAYFEEVAEAAGCTENCRLMHAWSVRDLVELVYHGTPTLRSELHWPAEWGEIVQHKERVVDWVKACHAAEEAVATKR
jgi:hypothetical protein